MNIAITNQGGLAPDKFYHRFKYVRALQAAGAKVVMLPLKLTDDEISLAIKQFDGFVFTGGADIDPKLYGHTEIKECGEINEKRDTVEMALLSRLIRLDKPILGICRGMQMINVASGGTLYQDLPSQLQTVLEHSKMKHIKKMIHEVYIQPNTRLSQIVRKPEMLVNSVHHQAIKELGRGLIVNAISPDNVIEGIEGENAKILGVQWHPEHIWGKSFENKAIFDGFLKMCGK